MATTPTSSSSSGDLAEKEAVTYLSGPGSLETGSVGFDAEATKKLLRRLDWHLVPFLALLYLCVPRPVLCSPDASRPALC